MRPDFFIFGRLEIQLSSVVFNIDKLAPFTSSRQPMIKTDVATFATGGQPEATARYTDSASVNKRS